MSVWGAPQLTPHQRAVQSAYRLGLSRGLWFGLGLGVALAAAVISSIGALS